MSPDRLLPIVSLFLFVYQSVSDILFRLHSVINQVTKLFSELVCARKIHIIGIKLSCHSQIKDELTA